MIQDIFPRKMDNQYKNIKPEAEDTVFMFNGSAILTRIVQIDDKKNDNHADRENPTLEYPKYKDFAGIKDIQFVYLFSIDEEKYFLAMRESVVQRGSFAGEMADSKIHSELSSIISGYEFVGVDSFRKSEPRYEAFAAITAFHLNCWYRDNRFCGRCGHKMIHSDSQRMVQCPDCKNMVFPKICPAVIVAVTNKDKILLTKYAGRTYRNYALVAGYSEIGETAEETVAREVFEEVGLKVKNIRYYKSQPWGLSGSLLYGYFCEVDGDESITLDENELAVGTWVDADEIDFEDDGISLTKEMILKFKKDCKG